MSDFKKKYLSVKFSIFCCLLRGPFPQNFKRISERPDYKANEYYIHKDNLEVHLVE